MRLLTGLAAVVLVGAGGLLWSHRGAHAAPSLSGPRVPVLVELFSSEGCSSCPPADEYLSTLDRTQPIPGVTVIALEEHVDYWDHLGWRDPFGSPAFGARQNDYARGLTDHRVYTPEIVFDGARVMPGGDEDAARDMMQASAREPKAKVVIARDGDRVTIDVTDVPPSDAGDATEVWLAITESNLSTRVPSGENAGRTLAHAPVVRRLQSLGHVASGAFHTTLPLGADPALGSSAVHVVAFVQRARSRAIVGAAST